MDAETLAWMIGAGAATGLGGLVLLAFPHPPDRLMDALLGFTAGVMSAATAFAGRSRLRRGSDALRHS